MNRRALLHSLLVLPVVPWLAACSRASNPAPAAGGTAVAPLQKPAEAWRDQVSAAAYRVVLLDVSVVG
jgi:peptide-methionine (R)-S-oxide reductase